MSLLLKKAISSTSSLHQEPKDISLPADATDTISSISWSPVADTNHLATASWDGKIRVYDVDATSRNARGVAWLAADGPLLDCDWAKLYMCAYIFLSPSRLYRENVEKTNAWNPVRRQDGSIVVAAGADRKSHMLHLATGQKATIGTHDAPIRSVRFVDIPATSSPILASGSWDHKLKLWDLRQQHNNNSNPLAIVDCGERVYAMDSKAQLLVVATAERKLLFVDLRYPTVVARTAESQLKHQTKAVAVAPDGKCFATASIEGRCGISAVDGRDMSSETNFTFRCHRSIPDTRRVAKVWSVNDVRFHPANEAVFVTAGSDGAFIFWNRVAHSKIKTYPAPTAPSVAAITATGFNHDGSLFAYATGYDWSFGRVGNTGKVQTRLMLHSVLTDDVVSQKK
ncbi:hypothetical protein M426DRAFT_28077 [Hypoxylon sp. CI-4A]|nr:hypothetical protein M426DRAFT_28077 [Hypoxylon sp. CI-4A]